MDWQAWHEDYETPDSALTRRLAVVQAQIRAALDRAAPGQVQAIGVSAGQGHDLIGVLADHLRRGEVTASLVELDVPEGRPAASLAASAASSTGSCGSR